MAGLSGIARSFRAQAAALLVVMGLFLAGGFLAAYAVESSIRQLIRQTGDARLQAAAAQDVLAALQDAETGQRGFLLTGRTVFLEPYYAASGRIDGLLADLAARTAAMPSRAAAGARLVAAARQKMAELQASIARVKQEGRAAAVSDAEADAAKRQMDEVRLAATRIIEAAERDRASQAELLRRRQALVTNLLLGGLVGGVLLLGLAALVLLWNLARLRAARQAEQLQSAQLEAAIEHMPDGVGVFDAAGQLTLVNARLAATLQLPPPHPERGTHLATIAAASRLEPPLLDGERPPQPVASEARQGARTLEIWRSPMPDGGQMLAVADLTRRVAAEAVARQAQKMDVLGQMTGGVAHDFNNLLQVVSANLELMRGQLRKEGRDGRLVQRLDAASAGVARGAQLVRHLLAFARRQPLAPQPLDPARLLHGMDELLRRSMGATVTFELAIEPGLWSMRADPAQFESAVLNLALNARDAMAGTDGVPRGTLTVAARNAEMKAGEGGELAVGAYVVCSVTDTGHGMTKAQAERALEPFYTTKPEGRGTGLGLPMVLGFAKQSGGHLLLQSEPGKGTTARLYIPRTTEPVPTEAPAPAAAHLQPGRGELVLLVEDDPAVRAAARDTLHGLGYRTLEAEDAAAGAALLEAGARPHVLLTDVVMPGPMTARQLADRAEALVPGIAVLFTSGYTQGAIGRDGQLDPGITLLGKPWRTDELARTLRAAIDAAAPRPRRALVVEDEPETRALVSAALAERGFDVSEAGDLAAALGQMQRRPDLLLTDLLLAGEDGMALVREARRRWPRLPVIVASGQDGVPETEVVWLPKPFDGAALDSAVETALAGA